MKAKLFISSFVVFFVGCSSAPKKVEPEKESVNVITPDLTAELDRVDRTIMQINIEIMKLKSLEEKIYVDAPAADPLAKKEFLKFQEVYGSLENLEAALKLLNTLKENLESQQTQASQGS